MKTYLQYREYKKPSWAPPAWVFGPVWTVLYVLIAISFGYIGYLFVSGQVGFAVVLPFVLNLVFNFAYTPIQFKLHNFMLAAADVALVVATLAWALVAVWPVAPWVAYINVPYLLWGCFATALQLSVTALNRKR